MQELRHVKFQAQSVFRTNIITNIDYPLSQCLVVWDSVVSRVTHYELDGPGIKSWWVRDLPHPSRLATGPTQPLIQQVIPRVTAARVRQ
jgi:hypothetical protein